jgi:uncharacterized metal-binding protein
MPDGKTHERLRASFSPIIVVECSLALWYGLSPTVSASLMLGYLSGKYLEPDLDIDHITESEIHIYQDFGFLVGRAWSAYWWPYAKIVPHRSWVSHWPFISTAFRLLYFIWPGCVASYKFQSVTLFLQFISTAEFIAFYLGLAQSDLIHITADIIKSSMRR